MNEMAVLKSTQLVDFSELEKLKNDKWTNELLNLHVIKDQLLHKLWAQKAKLSVLDRSHAVWALDQNMKAHVEKAVNKHSHGIDSTLSKYNNKLKELGALQSLNPTCHNVYLPPIIPWNDLYKLDVDQIIWEDCDWLEDTVPCWLANPKVKEGICYVQQLQNSHQELSRCKAEHANLHEWFTQEYCTYEALHKFFECHDDSVAFFAYEKLLFLQGVLNCWCINMESVPIAEDALVWISHAAIPLPEHHRPDLSGCVPMVDQEDLVSEDDQEDLELEVDNYDESELVLVAAEAIAASGSFEDSDDESEHTVEQV